jgi:hypothetical protein
MMLARAAKELAKVGVSNRQVITDIAQPAADGAYVFAVI